MLNTEEKNYVRHFAEANIDMYPDFERVMEACAVYAETLRLPTDEITRKSIIRMTHWWKCDVDKVVDFVNENYRDELSWRLKKRSIQRWEQMFAICGVKET